MLIFHIASNKNLGKTPHLKIGNSDNSNWIFLKKNFNIKI